ncbi:MAG: HDOD domain-containing protein [Pseudomonadota bacterium]
MAALMLTRDEVIERSQTLPSFPRFVTEILAALDDPEASLAVLAGCIMRDPVITARVLSAANTASMRSRRSSEVNDIYTAISLIGMSQVRKITLVSCLGTFVGGVAVPSLPATFWQHCVSVGVCCEELALHTPVPVSNDAALIAGLLHDVGQIWLYSFNASAYSTCWQQALTTAHGIDEVEREQFGVDHSTIGAWLAEHWELPSGIVTAIRGHHIPDAVLDASLVSVVHVAEVLSNALDLGGRAENRVTTLSSAACSQLGLVWDESIHPLFGSIEARSRYADTFFATAARP